MIGAVDIGGTKIAVGMIDGHGKVLARLECSTDADRGYPEALRRIVEMLRATAQTANTKTSGIGIGSTGPVYPLTGEIGDVNFFPHWKGENPVRDLSQIFEVRVAMENDADAAALGEAGWGAGQNKSRLIYVTVGTGIGTGLIVDGQVYRGVDQSHPEIGHHRHRSLWAALLVRLSRLLGIPGGWSSYGHVAGEQCTTGLFARCLISAPKRFANWLSKATPGRCVPSTTKAHYLGLGLANLVTMFVPEVIVLGGSVMKSAVLFLEGIRKVIAASCRFVPYEKTELALASLGEDSNLIGAARVWHYRVRLGGGDPCNLISP